MFYDFTLINYSIVRIVLSVFLDFQAIFVKNYRGFPQSSWVILQIFIILLKRQNFVGIPSILLKCYLISYLYVKCFVPSCQGSCFQRVLYTLSYSVLWRVNAKNSGPNSVLKMVQFGLR